MITGILWGPVLCAHRIPFPMRAWHGPLWQTAFAAPVWCGDPEEDKAFTQIVAKEYLPSAFAIFMRV
jgi:hypothetical protein